MTTDRPVTGQPLSREERARILELRAEGLSRNAIAREVGRSAGVVSKVVKEAGGSFERSEEVKAATEARKVDNATRRTRAVERLYDQVERLLDRLDADSFVTVGYDFGKAVRTKLKRDEIPPADLRQLATTITNLLHSAAKLEAVDAGHNAEAARAMITSLGEQVRALVGPYPGDDSDPD